MLVGEQRHGVDDGGAYNLQVVVSFYVVVGEVGDVLEPVEVNFTGAQGGVGLVVVGEFNDFDVDSLCLCDLDELVVGGVGAYYADFNDVVAGG